MESLEQLEQTFKSRLTALPTKEVKTGRDLIRRLLPEIEMGLAKGYSLFDLHLVLVEDGLPFSFETLRRYYREEKAAIAYHAQRQQSLLDKQPQSPVPDSAIATELNSLPTFPESRIDSIPPTPNPAVMPASGISTITPDTARLMPEREEQIETPAIALNPQSSDPIQSEQSPQKTGGSSARKVRSTTKKSSSTSTLNSSSSASEASIKPQAQPPPEPDPADDPLAQIQLGANWVDQSKYFNKY